VPALLEMLGVPYTAARVMALAITLDKAMTKRVLAFHSLPTPRFQEFHRADEPLDRALRFPLFTKPNREGTAIGISNKSIVRDEAALRERVAQLLAAYGETVLVEEYVDGRDITCGLVGNLADPNLPVPAAGIPSGDGHPGGAADWNGLHLFPLSEVDHASYEPGRAPIYSHRLKVDLADDYHSVCPAEVPAAIAGQVRRLTVETFRVTGCLDMGRVDFRLDVQADLQPQIIEINALPGITPISDLTLCALAEGWTYEQMINRVMDAAIQRHGLERLRRPAPQGSRAGVAARKTVLKPAAVSP
jgi:D-alanine-D-alanine ligase